MKLKFLTRRKSGYVLRIDKHYESFAFRDYSSKEECRRVAIKARNDYLETGNELHRLEYRARSQQRNNGTGVLGVEYMTFTRNGAEYHNYCARDLRKRKKYFGCIKHGPERAFILACEVTYKRRDRLTILDDKKLPVRLSLIKKHFQNVVFDKR